MAGAALWCGPGLAMHWPPIARLLGIPLTLGDDGRGVALTFDDGPHPEGTPAVLEELRRAGAKATFFLVGEQVERYPDLAAQIVEEGHLAAVHAHRHRNQMRLSPRAFAADLDRAVRSIRDACGVGSPLYRPPYGVFTPAGLAIARSRGLEPLLWSKWGRDWRADQTGPRIASLATRELSPGDVILLHDADWYGSPGCHRNTIEAVPLILEELDRQGLQPVRPHT